MSNITSKHQLIANTNKQLIHSSLLKRTIFNEKTFKITIVTVDIVFYS